MPDLPITRVHDPHLSLWQAVVAEQVRSELGEGHSNADVAADPRMAAANRHVTALAAGDDAEGAPTAPSIDEDREAHLSHLGLQMAMAHADGDTERAAALEAEVRKYSDAQWLAFLTQCISAFATYYLEYGGVFKYNDWQKEGGGNLSYGVVEWRLPNDATVGIIGDWGTGLDDARQLLRDLMTNHKPAAIIHLGDIYYAATPTECQANYATVISQVFDETLGAGNRIPVFTLAGNHDYYSLGYDFYDTFTAMNSSIAGAQQVASYFCLRTEDDGWQFLAMDTGWGDGNPGDQKDPTFAGPQLQPNEVTWLRHKLDTFAGATVLLSHHQLFSANAKINGMLSPKAGTPYLNTYLMDAFSSYFARNVAAWLWGHEHNFVLYQNGLFGLAKGRLVGNSAYEEATSEAPYAVVYPQVAYLDPTKYQLGSDGGYYNHGYAVIELEGRSSPTDPVAISYYEYPSWGDTPPQSPPSSTLIYTEQLASPAPPVLQPLRSTAGLHLLGSEGMYVGPAETYLGKRYPTASTELAAPLTFWGAGNGPVHHGDQVNILTTEQPGVPNILGQWSTTAAYYWTATDDDYERWTIQKRDPSDPTVHYGDDICIVNKSYGQSLQPYWSNVYRGNFLTTASGAYYWRVTV